MLLATLVDVSLQMQATPRRQVKVERLSAWLRSARGIEISLGVSYLSGRLPQGRIGVGGAVLTAMRAAPAACAQLALLDTDRAFAEIAAAVGPGSNAQRVRRLTTLFARATASEQSFLRRLLSGELRQGALEGVMLEAIARAANIPLADLRRAAMVASDLATVAQAVLTDGARALDRFVLCLLQPIQPMLAQPAESVEAALARFGEAAFDYKLDGARLQVHKQGEEVAIYTRSLKAVTASVPELVEAIRQLPASRLILDGEAIALASDGSPLPFQRTMQRFGRKIEVDRMRTEVPLSMFFFDCLHHEGEDLIGAPAHARFMLLNQAVPASLLVPRRITGERREAEAFLGEALARGHEGVVVKALDAPYEAGSRGGAWLKIKSTHTLDLVVLAAEWGHGRRRAWLSNLHLGARDPATGGYVMLGKTFKGMTDQMLAWQTQHLQRLARDSAGHRVSVRPELVVEVEFNNLQASPQYPGGLALRFARVKRYREDKRPEDADTIETVRRLYAMQGDLSGRQTS